MYATVRRYEGVIDTSEAESLVEEDFIPTISEVPGFVAYYWVDAGDGTTMSISLFEDQTGAEESNRRAADWNRETVASLLQNPPRSQLLRSSRTSQPRLGMMPGLLEEVP